MIKPYSFTLDIKGRNNTPRIECVIGDTNSYRLNITLVDGSLPVPLVDQTVRLVCRKADGTTVFQDFTIVSPSAGTISTVLSTQALAYLGNVLAEIKIYGLNTELLTSTRFNYRVVASLLDEDTVESANEYSTLTTALATVGAISSKANQTDLVIETNSRLSDQVDNAQQLALKRDKAAPITSTDLDISSQSAKIQPINVSDALMTMFSPAGTVSPVIPAKSIGTDKLSFLAVTGIANKNMFDKTTVTIDRYIVYSSGIVSGVVAGYTASDWIPILPNTQYVLAYLSQFAIYDANKIYISGVANGKLITSPSNGAFARITTLTPNLTTQQFELGAVATVYTPYGISLDMNFIAPKSIDDTKLTSTFVKKTVGKNLFNKATITTDHYIAYASGYLSPTTVGYNASDFLPCLPNTIYVKTDTQQFCFFDANKAYISGVGSASTFTTPADCYFIRITVLTPLLNIYQLEQGSIPTVYEAFGTYISTSELSSSIYDIPYSFESDMKILLPKNIDMLIGEEFSIYWRNVVKMSGKLKSGNYCIRVQKVVAGVYSQLGEDYGYKWSHTPTIAGQFDLEIRLYNIYRDTIVAKQVVSVTVSAKDQLTPKTATIITIGDSFTDGYYVSGYVHDLVTTSANTTLNMIGLNDSGKIGVKDDAWSGYSYSWLYGTATGYLRTDRPLEDANWDADWGMGEINGWTTGQVCADLTATQKLHGFTRNEFFNPVVGHFDFAYFMANRFPAIVPATTAGDHLDSVISFYGLNDSIWLPPTTLSASFPLYKTKLDAIVASIHAFDPAILIMLHLVTPQAEIDSFMNSYGTDFRHGDKAKYSQELWNEFMLTNYNTDAMIANNVFVVATNAHFDSRYSIRTKTITPNKFDLTIVETVTTDVHPNDVGAKYIADVARNFIISKVIK